MIAAYERVIGSCGLARQGGKLRVAALEARARTLGRASTAASAALASFGAFSDLPASAATLVSGQSQPSKVHG